MKGNRDLVQRKGLSRLSWARLQIDLVLCELEVLQGRFGNLRNIYNFFNRELKYSAAKKDSASGFLAH